MKAFQLCGLYVIERYVDLLMMNWKGRGRNPPRHIFAWEGENFGERLQL
jgi:hypothetical protein